MEEKNEQLKDSADKYKKNDELPPKKIHFIWVGGPIPPNYLRSIQNLAKVAKRSGFEINLWLDNKLNYTKTSSRYDINVPNLRLRNINELKARMETDRFYSDTPSKANRYWSYIDREMVGFNNLSAVSDLLRIEILRQEGGIYFDTDIKFKLKPDSMLKVDNLPFGIKIHGEFELIRKFSGEESKPKIRVNKFNGDIIEVLPNHEIMEMAIDKTLVKYQRLDEENLADRELRKQFGPYSNAMDSKRFPFPGKERFPLQRRGRTIEAGPGVVKHAVKAYLKRFIGDETLEQHIDSLHVTRGPLFTQLNGEIAGIDISAKCDNTWLNKLRKKGQHAFDTNQTTFHRRSIPLEGGLLNQNEQSFERFISSMRSIASNDEVKDKSKRAGVLINQFLRTNKSVYYLEKAQSLLKGDIHFLFLHEHNNGNHSLAEQIDDKLRYRKLIEGLRDAVEQNTPREPTSQTAPNNLRGLDTVLVLVKLSPDVSALLDHYIANSINLNDLCELRSGLLPSDWWFSKSAQEKRLKENPNLTRIIQKLDGKIYENFRDTLKQIGTDDSKNRDEKRKQSKELLYFLLNKYNNLEFTSKMLEKLQFEEDEELTENTPYWIEILRAVYEKKLYLQLSADFEKYPENPTEPLERKHVLTQLIIQYINATNSLDYLNKLATLFKYDRKPRSQQYKCIVTDHDLCVDISNLIQEKAHKVILKTIYSDIQNSKDYDHDPVLTQICDLIEQALASEPLNMEKFISVGNKIVVKLQAEQPEKSTATFFESERPSVQRKELYKDILSLLNYHLKDVPSANYHFGSP